MRLSIVSSIKKVSLYQPIMCECPCCGDLVAQDIVPKLESISFLSNSVEYVSQHYKCRISGALWQSRGMIRDEADERAMAERKISAIKRVLGMGGKND